VPCPEEDFSPLTKAVSSPFEPSPFNVMLCSFRLASCCSQVRVSTRTKRTESLFPGQFTNPLFGLALVVWMKFYRGFDECAAAADVAQRGSLLFAWQGVKAVRGNCEERHLRQDYRGRYDRKEPARGNRESTDNTLRQESHWVKWKFSVSAGLFAYALRIWPCDIEHRQPDTDTGQSMQSRFGPRIHFQPTLR